jgi:hypothetical protein
VGVRGHSGGRGARSEEREIVEMMAGKSFFHEKTKIVELAEKSTLVQWDSKKGDHRARESRFRELT